MAAAEESFVRAPRSVLRPGSPLLPTFVPGAGILGRGAVVPLASHGGLLLVRLVDGTAAAEQEEGEEPAAEALDHLAVCDLNSGACHVLPPLHCGWFFDYFSTSAYAVLPGSTTADDSSAASSSFKVLVIGINEDKRQYYLRTCSSSSSSSSSSGCWSSPSKLFDPMEHGIFGPIKQRDAAVVVSLDQRGVRHYTAHWLLWDLAHFHALAVDAATGEASLHRLPVPPRDLPFHLYDMPRLAAAPDGATLSALCLLRNEGRLRVEAWTRRRRGEDGGELGWHHDRVVELQSRSKEMDGALCVCFGERSGTLLARDRERCLYVADLENRGGAILEEVPAELRVSGGCKTAVAVEIDWPALFACRLGGK